MSGQKRIALFVLIAGGVIALIFGMPFAHEPAYGGKRLSAWLAKLGQDTLEDRATAVAAIRNIGTNAAPAVIGLLRYKESAFRRKLRELAAKQSVLKLNFEDPRRRRQRGLIACDALGPAGVPVIPTLVNLLTNEQPPEPHIPYLLARIGNPAIPALNSALTNGEKVIRMGATYCLALLQTNSDFLHPEIRPIAEQDYYLRTCQYNGAMIQIAASEYAARHRHDLPDIPSPSLAEHFDPAAFEAVVPKHAKQSQPTNTSSPFE